MKTKLSFLARSVILLWMLVVGSFNAQASITSDGNTYIYIKNFKPSGWDDCWKCPGVEVYCYFFTGTVNAWSNKAELVSGTENGIDAIYRVNVPSGTWSTIIITRGTAPSWSGKYNQSGNIPIPDNKNYIQTFAEDSPSATWDFYSTNFTVTYNGNGSDIGDVPATSTADDEGNVTIAGQGTLVRTGYSFNNWKPSPDGSGESYIPGETKTINSNLTLYAQWTERMHTVTVSAGDHGSVDITSASVGISTNATITATPYEGYRFVSWTKTGNVTIANVNDATTTITATGDDATVTANFEKIPEYVNITVAVRTTGEAKEKWNSDAATTAYFWEPHSTFPGDEVTSKLTYDGHKYFYKTYTVPYGGTLKIFVHNIASPNGSMYDTRSEEICIENVTTDKTYYYSYGAYLGSNGSYCYSTYKTEDDSGYYLVVNNTRRAGVAGRDIVKYKFQPVLIREKANPELSETLYTLTLPDFVLTGAQKRAENPNCFDSENTMYYTIQKGDGSVIYQPNNNYQLGYGVNNFKEHSNGNLTNVQMESYGAPIKKSKTDADAEGYNFFLQKSTLAKSYTWYLNIGTTKYDPGEDYGKRFTPQPHSVTIAANQLVEGHTKNAIVEQNNASGVQDYYLTGNLKFGGNNTKWDPVKDKMKMTRMFFKGGKSYVAGSTADVTAENCDSIVYVLQMVRPKDGWGNMFLSMAGERNLDAYNSTTKNMVAWWATLIRPQVFTNMDAQWNFGGLEVNGILDNGSYTTSYGNTSQAINPILDNTVTGYTAYFNMTNATYRLVYYKVSESSDEGLYIIGPAVAGFGDKTISGNDSYHASNGRKVKLVFNSETGAYEAIGIKLTNGQNFRFANIKQTTTVKTEGGYETSSQKKSAYESYYDEDEIVPARDGEPGGAAWFDANTWETDYFNRLSKLKNADDVQVVTDGTPVKFELPTGTYNVRFYTKYLGANGETVTNAYYTIDYHIGIRRAEDFGTDISKGAGSKFPFHKTWSSRLAYVNNGLDAYYVSGWTWKKDEQKKTATANVTLSKLNKPKYLVARKAMILTDGALNADKMYVIVPGDPYGYSSDVTACDFNNTNANGISVRPIYETENYETGMKSAKNSDAWKEWSRMVGPGAFDGEKYTTRNFTFAMIVPTWNTDKRAELDFWRVKSTNEKMSGHKFLVVAPVPNGTNDLESGKAFSSHQSGGSAKSMANYMTISIEGDDDIVTDIQNVQSEEEIVSNGRIYNLMGVEVKTPIRGQLYIINGRKAIMK